MHQISSQPRAQSADPLQELISAFGLSGAQRARAAQRLLQVVDARIEEFVAEKVAPRLELFASHYPTAALGGGVARAMREGEQRKREVLEQADVLPPEAAAGRAGMSRQALDERRKAGRALALTHVKRGFRYPAWQFEDAVAGAMMGLLPELAHLDAWARYFFFVQPEPLLDGRSPLEALRAGEAGRVIEIARILRGDAAA